MYNEISLKAAEISESNRGYLEFLRDIYEVSVSCSTRTYIWGGFTIDILEGRFLREHKDLDGFTANMLMVLDEMTMLYKEKGYRTKFFEDVHMLEIRKGDLHASFNRLETEEGTAMWRHIGDQGTVYFPEEWLDDISRDFYNAKVYTSGAKFEYAIKKNARLLNPEWQTREKDYSAIEYLEAVLKSEGINREDIFKRIWSYNPYWIEKGYEGLIRPDAL